MDQNNQPSPIGSIEVTFRRMLPRDALVYFVRRCAQSKRLSGDSLRASLEYVEPGSYHAALELRSGRRVIRATAIHAAALVALWRCFERLAFPRLVSAVAHA